MLDILLQQKQIKNKIFIPNEKNDIAGSSKNIQLTAVTGDNRIFDAALQTKKQKQNKILNKTILSG